MFATAEPVRFVNPIPFVRDMAMAKQFYAELLGLRVAEDHGNFVRFESGFAIHDGPSLERAVWGDNEASSGRYGRRNLVLYFEHDDIDQLFHEIGSRVELIHPPRREPWGQRVFRLYDPDRHVVEIGEPQGRE